MAQRFSDVPDFSFIAKAGQQIGEGIEKYANAVDVVNKKKIGVEQFNRAHDTMTQVMSQKYDEANPNGDQVKKQLWLQKYFPPLFEGETPAEGAARLEKSEQSALKDVENTKVQNFQKDTSVQSQESPVADTSGKISGMMQPDAQTPQQRGQSVIAAPQQAPQQQQPPTTPQQRYQGATLTGQVAQQIAPAAPPQSKPNLPPLNESDFSGTPPPNFTPQDMTRLAGQMNITDNKDVQKTIGNAQDKQSAAEFKPGQPESQYLAAQAAKTGSISPTVAAIGSAVQAENKMNKAKSGTDSSPFEPGTQEYEFAKRMVGIDDNGNKTDITLPFDKSMQLYSSMGGSIGNRSRLLSTAYQLDPKYSAQGSIAGEKFATSHAGKSATLTPDIISGEANKANAVAAAKLEPNVTSPSIEKQARGNTAKVLNNQRSAAARALSTFEDAKNKTNGNYDNVPDFMYRDLASDYAKMLVASGQMSEGSVDKVMQGSASGAVVKLWNYATGDTKTTAPQKVLSLMHDRIKALSTDLDKQYYNQVQGTNLPVNSNQSTNPLRTTQDSSIPKVTDASSYKSVSSGSQYYDPNGNLRTKP